MILRLIILLIIAIQVNALTLDEIFKYAETNSPKIKITKSNEKISQMNKYKSIGNFLPSATGALNYLRLDSVPTFLMSTPIGVQKIEMGVKDNYSFEVNFSLPIFMGGKLINAYLISREKSEISKLETKKALSDIKMAIVQIYTSCLLLNEMEYMLNELYKSTEEHYNVAKKRYEDGMASKLELLAAQTQLKAIKPQIEQIKNEYINLINTLKLLIGYEDNNLTIDETIQLVAEYYNVDRFEKSQLKELKTIAINKRNDLKITEKNLSIIKKAYNITKYSLLPNIFAFSKYKYYNMPRNGEELYVFNDTLLMDQSLIFGISIQFDIFQGGSKIIDIINSNEQLKQVNLMYNNQKNSINNEIENTYNNYILSIKNMELYKSALETAEESYRMAKQQYREGVISNSDYLDIEINYIQSKVNYSKGIYNQIIQYFSLLNSIGQL